ncbi:DC-STAMP domain-containing protein 2-like isoform X2 [Nasonia vitripennis]|uniref:Dendritic cell-specific transmembrane protein-like domain-containing protein n=1 Tax=Nasonia vitripennis TaxID=7425 RepID=A0A7M7GE26_NASVI|nr:DC-STAMP domain-containing protein 2-like isoform X2 [Nasonia vitripennis]
MAFFQLVLKAKKLKKAKRRYHEEKLRSIEISKGARVHYALWQRIRRKKILLKKKLREFLTRCTSCPENTWLHKKAVLLRTEGTLENYVLKSVFGFVGGIILTYMFFVFFVFQLHFALISATLICCVLGVVLTLGLAFSPRIRCYVLLFLPQFFSKRGRQALMAYAFILALGGPVKNSLYNLAVLSESLACGQEQLKEAVKSVIDLIKQPFYALRDSLSSIVKSIKAIVKRIKQTLIAIKRLVISILQVIKSVFDWLGSVVSICNRDLGTPYDRCNKVFEDAVDDCQEKLGPVFGEVCHLTYVAQTVCLALKPLDLICVLVSYVSDAIVGVVRDRVKKFSREMKAMFYVKIKFSHSFHMETNKSQSISEISSKISSEIRRKTNRFLSFFDWVGFVTSFLFILLFLRVVYYRYKWLTSDRFDNHYISGYMREIDLKRARQDKETIFPLNQRERSKYAPVSSVLLIRSEKVKLTKSAVFLSITSVKLAIYMAIDYCLFWLLDKIRYHGRIEKKVPRPSYSDAVQVEGTGFLADIYRSIIRAFTPDTRMTEIESVPCLPEPKPPNYDTFVQILSLVLFCWLMALFEPYGLRLRQIVLSSYYPDRAKQRAVWLYNHIIRSRGSFLKYARRQLRRQFGTARGDGIERVTLRERLWALCPLLNRLWPLKLGTACLLCGQPERDKSAPHVRCPTPGCPGVYCPQCFQDLKKLCTLCLSPLDYGDLTDMSEERDSSDEQVDVDRLRKIAQEAAAKKEKTDEATADSEETKLIVSPKASSDDESSSSKYSYSYQDEPPKDTTIPQKVTFKDVEAQEIRDDVTMQIFDDASCDELLSSSSEGRIFCFGLFKQKKSSHAYEKVREQSDVSSSIEDTESWLSEEIVDEEEQLLDVEIENIIDRPSDSEDICEENTKRKRSRFKWLSKTLNKIFASKKKKEKRGIVNYKDSIQTGHGSEESCSSISSDDGENRQLLVLRRLEDYAEIGESMLRQRSNKSSTQYSCMTKFETRKVPRYLKSICNETRYFEIDESSQYNSPRESIRFQADFSPSTDTRSTVDSDPSHERPSSNTEDNDSYIYTSDNHSDKRYQSQTETSNSSIPDEIDFSDISTDYSERRNELLVNNDKAIDKEDLTEEDKINEDSDEKGQSHKTQAKYKRKQVYDSRTVGLKLHGMAEKAESKRISDDKYMKKFDELKKDKVDKETANTKKKNSLIQKKSSAIDNNKANTKIDKSTDMPELNTNFKTNFTERRVGGSDHCRCVEQRMIQEREYPQKLVRGFQPIIFERSEHSETRFNPGKCYDARKVDFSENSKGTRDKGTYVRLKTKETVTERKNTTSTED